jgi:hypothetical protein|tara:strand:- start:14196 stop:14312 length:117 start_codon:yes stop_codon:yes gene_type:complete
MIKEFGRKDEAEASFEAHKNLIEQIKSYVMGNSQMKPI